MGLHGQEPNLQIYARFKPRRAATAFATIMGIMVSFLLWFSLPGYVRGDSYTSPIAFALLSILSSMYSLVMYNNEIVLCEEGFVERKYFSVIRVRWAELGGQNWKVLGRKI